MNLKFLIGASIVGIFVGVIATRFISFTPEPPPEVGLLGVIEPNHIVLGEATFKQATIQLYASYDYDVAVLGIAVHTPNQKTRYLPLYGSAYRGLPPFQADMYVSQLNDGMWIKVAWDGAPYLLEYFPLAANDGSPVLQPQDSYFFEPIPSSFSSNNNLPTDLDPNASNVLSVRHNGE